MLLLPHAVRVYVATSPVSLRKSFDGLCNKVRSVLGHNPLSGHVFVFINRRRTQVKLLVWTRGAFTVVHRRLERGRYRFPSKLHSNATSVQIDAAELSMLLEGLVADRSKSARRWTPGQIATKAHQRAFLSP
jgi:transposase